jgi:hypothetical protein
MYKNIFIDRAESALFSALFFCLFCRRKRETFSVRQIAQTAQKGHRKQNIFEKSKNRRKAQKGFFGS